MTFKHLITFGKKSADSRFHLDGGKIILDLDLDSESDFYVIDAHSRELSTMEYFEFDTVAAETEHPYITKLDIKIPLPSSRPDTLITKEQASLLAWLWAITDEESRTHFQESPPKLWRIKIGDSKADFIAEDMPQIVKASDGPHYILVTNWQNKLEIYYV